jgi:hypothetical protein
MALGGVRYIEGLIYPFPLCGELITNGKGGVIYRKTLYATDGAPVVTDISKTDPASPCRRCRMRG